MSLRTNYLITAAGGEQWPTQERLTVAPRVADVPYGVQVSVLDRFAAWAWTYWYEHRDDVMLEKRILGLFPIRITWSHPIIVELFTRLFGPRGDYLSGSDLDRVDTLTA